jgi:hypothetical protein
MEKKKHLFKVGETAYLKDNPLDEQLDEFIPLGNKIITEVLDVSHVEHTSGQWLKIAEHDDWIDSAWFNPITNN